MGLIDPTKTDEQIANELEMEGGGLDLNVDPALEPAVEEPPPAE
jgi:hypothetical protein